jgi:hypothetical protein
MSSVLVCDGTLDVSSTGVVSCSQWLPVPSEMVFIANLFQIPPVADLQQAFMIPFGAIMTVYLASWAYGQLIQFISSEKH